MKLSIAVGAEEKLALIRPLITRECGPNDPEWCAIAARDEVKWRKRALRRHWLGWLPGMRRDQGDVRDQYARHWRGRTVSELLHGKCKECIVWHDLLALGEGHALKRIHLLYLMRAIEELQPRRVLEVGCGNGANLFVLATQFPDIEFCGVELTPEGVDALLEVTRQPTAPAFVSHFSPLPPRDLLAHRRVTARQGDAAALSFRSDSFCMVISVQALEQMEAVREAALREIARVSSKWVAMAEPFREVNASRRRRDRIVSQDYFQGAVADLPRYGLQPIFTDLDLPSKINLGIAVVVAEKVRPQGLTH